MPGSAGHRAPKLSRCGRKRKVGVLSLAPDRSLSLELLDVSGKQEWCEVQQPRSLKVAVSP